MKPYTLRCENANLILEMKNRNRNAARPIRWIGSIGLRQNGFTLVELLVTVAIIGVLAALILPAVQSYFKRARAVGCMSSLRQVYIGATQFAADNQGAMPYTGRIVDSSGNTTGWDSFWIYKASDYAIGSDQEATLMCPDGPFAKGKQISPSRQPQANYGVNARYLCYLASNGAVTGAMGPKTRLLRFYDIPATAVLYYDSGGSVMTQETAKAPSPAWGYIPGCSLNKSVSSYYAPIPKVTVDAHAGRHGGIINFIRGDGSAGHATADTFVMDSQYW